MSRRAKLRSVGWTGLKLLPWLAAGILLLWVLRSVPLRDTWDTLRQLTLRQAAALMVLNGLVLAALNGRWWLILRGQGHRIPFLALFGYRLAAFGLSYYTPGPHFGGEPLQVYLVEKGHDTPRAAAVAAMTLDKSLELLVNFTFLLVGVLVILQGQILGVGGGETAVIALLLLLLPLGYLLAIWFNWQPVSHWMQAILRLPIWKRRPQWQKKVQNGMIAMQAGEIDAHLFCRRAPGFLLLALLITLLSWGLMIAEFWLMVSFLGIRLSAVQLVTALAAARFAILLLLPGSLGVLEASQAFAFGALGLNPAVGVGVSLLIRARDVILGGIGLWWGSRRMVAMRQNTHGGV